QPFDPWYCHAIRGDPFRNLSADCVSQEKCLIQVLRQKTMCDVAVSNIPVCFFEVRRCVPVVRPFNRDDTIAPMLILVLALIGAEPENRPFTSPASADPEYGHGLSAEQARAGWISLFDGRSLTGWKRGEIERGSLGGGQTTTSFGSCELQGEAEAAGEIAV